MSPGLAGQGAGSRSRAIVAGARGEEAPPRQMGTALMRRLPRAAPRCGGLPRDTPGMGLCPHHLPPRGCGGAPQGPPCTAW